MDIYQTYLIVPEVVVEDGILTLRAKFPFQDTTIDVSYDPKQYTTRLYWDGKGWNMPKPFTHEPIRVIYERSIDYGTVKRLEFFHLVGDKFIKIFVLRERTILISINDTDYPLQINGDLLVVQILGSTDGGDSSDRNNALAGI